MDIKVLGRHIVRIRKELQMNQNELGKLVGVSRNYISLIERGEAERVSLKVLNQIAHAFGMPVAQLTGELDDQSIVMIPPELREFGLKNKLNYETIDKLANLPRRGHEPKSVKEWQDLYKVIEEYIK
jgi:transcriptional regulator with XRE-family HTH domain